MTHRRLPSNSQIPPSPYQPSISSALESPFLNRGSTSALYTPKAQQTGFDSPVLPRLKWTEGGSPRRNPVARLGAVLVGRLRSWLVPLLLVLLGCEVGYLVATVGGMGREEVVSVGVGRVRDEAATR